MGFEVIKIEKPGTGDVARELSGSSSGTFMYYNRGKKSLELDIRTEKGKNVFKKLVRTADIVIENMAPGTMDRLGFSYEELKKINSKIIYMSIKGYMDGPYKNRKSLDYPIEIESGHNIMKSIIETGGIPMYPFIAYNGGESYFIMHFERLSRWVSWTLTCLVLMKY